MVVMVALASSLSLLASDVTSDSALERSLNEYLESDFPARIDQVRLGASEITIRGHFDSEKVPSSGNLFIAETPIHVLHGATNQYTELTALHPEDKGRFELILPRFRPVNEQPYDRMSSRWTVLLAQQNEKTAISAAHWVDEIDEPAEFPPSQNIAHKKGLGGWQDGILPDELHDLGIAAITMNLVLDHYIALHAVPDTEPISWQGHQFFVRMAALRALDAQLLKAAEDKVVVSAILLITNHARKPTEVNAILGHPDATEEGIFAMPNVTDETGVALYGAVLKLLTDRYCRADARYGRIHHWIIHNEVDAGLVWTNAGEKSTLTYLDLYQRSLRLVDLFARQRDPASRAFVSLDHHWASAGKKEWHSSRRLLESLVRYGEVEGDFPWALAYHPYPQNLFEPRTWRDDQATDSFDTVKITPRNLEVLDAWMKQDRLLYRGKVRPVHLSENGFNSRDYSPGELEAQAAGMAYAWKKIQSLSAIQVWHYHNWIDNKGEGGLRIGLRKFRDDPAEALAKKPIWEVYRAAGTTEEDAVFQPYLSTIGIKNWDQVRGRELRP